MKSISLIPPTTDVRPSLIPVLSFYFQPVLIEDTLRIMLRPLRFGENFYAAQPLGDIERMTEKLAMLYNQRFEIEYKSKALKSNTNFFFWKYFYLRI